jgi:hypothetical protein
MKEWKKIPNYSLYHASTDGEIKTFNWKNKGKEAIMKPAKDEKGYLRTMLKDDSGRIKTIKVHRIIAFTFLDKDTGMDEVNHKNGIKDDNRIENLEWSNRSKNVKHAFDLGLCTPLSRRKVIDSLTGKIYDSCSELARLQNMPKSTLQSMLSGYRKNKTQFNYISE